MNKKRIVYFGLVLTAFIGFQSCRTPDGVPAEKPAQGLADSPDVKVDKVADGYLTGNGEEKIVEGGMVINSQAEWDALTAKMNSVNETIEVESIDFNRATVLAYFDKVRGSGGYTVEIATVMKDGDKLVAKVRKASPTGDAIEIMTQPFVIATIEKTSKSVSFAN